MYVDIYIYIHEYIHSCRFIPCTHVSISLYIYHAPAGTHIKHLQECMDTGWLGRVAAIFDLTKKRAANTGYMRYIHNVIHVCIYIYTHCVEMYWEGACILTVGATRLTFSWHLVVWDAKTLSASFYSSALHRLRWSAATMARPCTKCSCPENFWSCQLIWDSDLELVMTTKLNPSSSWPWKTSRLRAELLLSQCHFRPFAKASTVPRANCLGWLLSNWGGTNSSLLSNLHPASNVLVNFRIVCLNGFTRCVMMFYDVSCRLSKGRFSAITL